VSRVTAYEWLSRYETQGIAGLVERSRAPHSHPNAVSEEVMERVLALRQQRTTWGAVKLLSWLGKHEPDTHWPCATTVGEWLRERGLTKPNRRRRVGPYNAPLAHCDGPNRVWSADFKGWFLTGDGVRCDPLTISDGYSRYLLRCQALARPTYEAVRPLFEATLREYGLPMAIRTDNGVPFAATKGLGLSRLSVWWIKLGITPERIEPGKPQQNGRHERMHKTLKAEAINPPAKNLREQQHAFDAFQRDYNEQRPHQALKNETPASCYVPSTRPYPPRLAIPDYPSGWKTQRVYDRGTFCWRRQPLFLTYALAGETIALAPTTNERYIAIYFAHMPIAWLDTKTDRVLHVIPKELKEQTIQ
jgi:transposase InsO family protein